MLDKIWIIIHSLIQCVVFGLQKAQLALVDIVLLAGTVFKLTVCPLFPSSSTPLTAFFISRSPQRLMIEHSTSILRILRGSPGQLISMVGYLCHALSISLTSCSRCCLPQSFTAKFHKRLVIIFLTPKECPHPLSYFDTLLTIPHIPYSTLPFSL